MVSYIYDARYNKATEGIETGKHKIVDTEEEVIYQNFKELLENKKVYDAMARASNPYGDGLACRRIVNVLEDT